MSFPRYRAYKSSTLDGLGIIPSHWTSIAVKRLAAVPIQNGVGEAAIYENPAWPRYLRITDIAGPRRLRDDTFKSLPPEVAAQSPVRVGDLLVAAVGATFGKSYLHTEDIGDCCYAGYLIRFSPNEALHPGFAAYWTESSHYWDQVNARVVQSTVQNFSAGKFRELSIVLPPISEQLTIAAFLDHETAKIDALIAEQERLIELLSEKCQAAISHLVTKGVNSDAPMKDSCVDWLGEVPSHWMVSQLRYVIRSGTSITYGIVQAGPHIEDGVPYIKTSDMSGSCLPLDGYSKTSAEIDSSYARSKVSAGDLVIAIRASVGKCLPVPPQLDGANLTQGTAKISPGDLTDGAFLLAYINALQVQTYLNSVSKGATFKEITLDTLRRTPVLLPPIVEQRLIASEVHRLRSQFQDLIDGARAAEELLRERRAALISAAVIGQIDVRKAT